MRLREKAALIKTQQHQAPRVPKRSSTSTIMPMRTGALGLSAYRQAYRWPIATTKRDIIAQVDHLDVSGFHSRAPKPRAGQSTPLARRLTTGIEVNQTEQVF